MPNGYHGPEEDWERMEAPLVALDSLLEGFAKSHGMALSRNYHNWPERSLTLEDDLSRLIQIFLVDESQLTFNFWVCATQDRDLERFWKQDYLAKEVSSEELRANISDWLERGHKAVMEWKAKDLVFANRIQKLP